VATYPIPEARVHARMFQELIIGVIGTVKGTVTCIEILDRPEHSRK
jgi:hypothetical protein